MFVEKVKTNILGIFNESLFFLNEEISVLSHTLIDILRFALLHSRCCFIGDNPIASEMDILKVLIGFFEVEELALDVEGGHENDIITQSNLNF